MNTDTGGGGDVNDGTGYKPTVLSEMEVIPNAWDINDGN